MVKRYAILLALFFLLASCNDMLATQGGGIRSKRNFKKFIDDRTNPLLSDIKTKVIYKKLEIAKYSYAQNAHNLSQKRTNNGFLLFHENGNVYSFVYPKVKQLNEADFDTIRGKLDYLLKRENNIYHASYRPINEGVFVLYSVEVDNDTLIMTSTNHGTKISYYYYPINLMK